MEKILIVDDNLINRKVLCKMLQDFYEIEEADCGEAALEIMKDEKVDILAVLLDIVMPGMNGMEVLQEMQNSPRLAAIPVIVQTENTDLAFESKALKLGATDFVSKPYNADIIRTRLQNVINTRIMLNEVRVLGEDELTGLMGVNQFYVEGDRWIGKNPDMKFDVVALEIMNFEIINDSQGVEIGNKILVSVADAIQHVQENTRFLASRLHEDRFVLLLRREEGYTNRLIEEADKITKLYAGEASVHMKFGIYEITEEKIDLSVFCGRAFSATSLIMDLYGNHCAYYDDSLHKKIRYEEKINNQMEKALSDHQFVVYFQAKIDLFTNSIAGAEALVRWIHPEDGIISPGVFVPIFEKNGFVVKLDQFVWDTAASKLEAWIKAGNKAIPVSVNISRIDIDSIDVIEVLTEIVEKHHLSPELLHLEITESAYIQDADRMIDMVTELRNKGFAIEMDDFGSGYSSLNMLAKLPIDILKLDMKFIRDIENSRNARTIIEYTIGLAKWMNLPVVAEGVETEEQLALLKTLGCHYVQGYIFAKPLPEDQFLHLLKSYQKGGAEDKKILDLTIRDTGFKQNMLIVEDLALNRAIISSYFDDSFNIIEAVNGKVALKYLLKGSKVDIIILDLYMPEMNGYEFLKEIKQDEALKKIPILAISSQTHTEEEKKAVQLGADAFISKPFTLENIYGRVRTLLREDTVLDNLNLWDLRDVVENPWLTEICREVVFVNTETEKISQMKDNHLGETQTSYLEKVPPKIYSDSLTQVELGQKAKLICSKVGQTTYAKKIIFEGISYLIFFFLE